MAKTTTTQPKGSADGAYAIVEAAGQQFWIQPNRYYDIDRLKAEVDSKITLSNVLLFNDGKEATLGKPYIEGASVELKVLEHRRGPKIIVYKMRPKKKTRRKNGHRQELTRVLVESISLGEKSLKVEKATKTSKTKVESVKPAQKTTKAAATPKTTKKVSSSMAKKAPEIKESTPSKKAKD